MHQTFNWSTSNGEMEDKFSEFDSILSKSLIKVTTVISNPADFWCHLSSHHAGLFSVTDINGSVKQSRRSAKDLARSESDAFHLVYSGLPWLFVNHLGHELPVPAGTLVLIDTRKQYISSLPEGFLNRTVTLPREWLQTWIPEPEKIIELNLCHLSGWGKVIASYIENLSPQYLEKNDFQSSLLLDQLGVMLSFLYNEVVCENASPGHFSHDRHYQRIVDSLQQRHTNILLKAEEIAHEVGMSIRNLHRVMANQGTSYGQVLMNFRAQTALRMLKADKYDELSISEIARRAGFVDTSHFSRVCKKHFGLSPGQIRKNRDSHR
ncbi:transcriptional regulator, AraC family [[Enterobacter] lignolyticus SCF1]|uniref:Transcriptional regulator, AraC family n=2 Tax=[Enterobacter] lignolyticus TaxID=1334193 RepID=E3GBD0_ENTLS|nr:transcriptional regulator, AraC family [[Enterobacter] lignolyticus SCF1]